MKFADLVKSAHTMARSKGWHDDAPADGRAKIERCAALLALTHTEINELQEALTQRALGWEDPPPEPDWHWEADKHVRAEVADIAIRLADLWGYAGWDAGDISLGPWPEHDIGRFLVQSDVDACLMLHGAVSDITQTIRVADPSPPLGVINGLRLIGATRPWLGSLEDAVTEKMRENADRPYRHGNKRI